MKKRTKDCFIQEDFLTYASRKLNIFTQTKSQYYQRETYLNLENHDNRTAIIKLRLSSHDLAIEGTLLGPKQFLAIESSLKKMENTFYFTLKALFDLKIFKFLS